MIGKEFQQLQREIHQKEDELDKLQMLHIKETGHRHIISGPPPFTKKTIDSPPLGIMPKTIHDQKRAIGILEAMQRYVSMDKAIPTEWFDELMYLYSADVRL